ncbi:MAG: hypothetical protein ACXVCY_04175 [Pseudobdellovibrionaceae bacterium]
MAVLFGEKLIEYAIRIAADDFVRNPKLVDWVFYTDKQLNQGTQLLTNDPNNPEYEPLVMDYFQQRLAQIPRRKGEEAMADIFSNTVQTLPDIKEYLQTANVKLIHGFPRDSQDLPCLCINLGGDDEKQYLGQVKEEITTDDGTYLLVGPDWNTHYFINVITPNYDETIIWQIIIKYALTVYRPHLESYGLRNLSMSWMDIQLDSALAQAGIFAYQRTCSVACERDEIYPVSKDGYEALGFSVNSNSGDITP